MRKLGFAEMNAFVAIAERSSFAKAATHLGISRSTLSETIRGLEEKLGVRLLNRTTRSVALTEVGERLLAELRPALDSFDAAVESVNVFRDKPAGHLRLTIPRPAGKMVIEPILAKFLAAYPAISLEIITDSALTDIVRDRFDAGIRPGHRLEQDMIAVRVGEDARPTVVASPDYLLRHPRPKVPGDLQAHNCIRQRFASGAMHHWVFEKRGKSLEVLVKGSLIVSDGDLAIRAALDGVGIARSPLSSIDTLIEQERLVPLLEDWAPPSVGFFLYYPSRRQTRAALQAFVDFLRAHSRNDDGPKSDRMGKPVRGRRREKEGFLDT
jgi:DNA-binding transcriptional LysR family regulator